MKIRNPSPEEIVAYERAAHESQGTMLDMSDFEIVIRGKYGAAPGVSIQPDGKLVVGERVVATLADDEMATLLKLRLGQRPAARAPQDARPLHGAALRAAEHRVQVGHAGHREGDRAGHDGAPGKRPAEAGQREAAEAGEGMKVRFKIVDVDTGDDYWCCDDVDVEPGSWYKFEVFFKPNNMIENTDSTHVLTEAQQGGSR
jgi:hypothetical protein